jgi:hypothetical protein
MKKKYLIFSVFLLVFPSCETEFDVHAAWEEITVVYGLLDQSQDRQYIKINKAYLGAGDALQIANIADSINFLAEDMEVRLYKLQGQDTVDFINLDTTTAILKDDGLFASGIRENIIYVTLEQDSDFVQIGRTYALTIKNTESGNFVSANTEVIGVPIPPSPFFTNIHSFSRFGFYNPFQADSAKFLIKKINWSGGSFENGEIYQVDIRFNYKENNIDKFLVWRQSLVGYSNSMSTTLEGAKFFNYLRNNLEDDNAINREFISIDVLMTIGTSELATYIAVNTPFEGIAQERPAYSNINNGIGLFSARYTYELLGLELSDYTQDYLKDELNRNFE